MDLRLFFSVLWRFRVVVVTGMLLSIVLAVLTTFKVDGSGLSYRTPEVWKSNSLILLTQQGFPWGRSTLNDVIEVPTGRGKPELAPRFADTPRYQGLAVIYADLATSDPVRRMMLKDGPINGQFGAQAVRTDDGTSFLPLIEITAYGASADAARALARRATNAFRSYLAVEQEQNSVPQNQRVEVPVIKAPARAELFEGHSISRPLFVLLLGIMLVVGIVFGLHNLRPAPPAEAWDLEALDWDDEPEPHAVTAREGRARLEPAERVG